MDKKAPVETNNKMSLKAEKGNVETEKSNFWKHFILGSLISLVIGALYVSLRNGQINIFNIKNKIAREIVHHEVRTQGDFGEEIPVDEFIESKNIIVEEIENADESEEELLAQYDEEMEEEFEEETDNEDEQKFNESEMNKLLREDLNYELDEGFSQNKDDSINDLESTVIGDDPETAEYEHEIDDLIDNNWSDDEAELKRMENEVVHQ
ncbi:hypothetical protein FG386_001297 [Cryptosporidium ryanae]|uniref:uncharacterized protein n=1 Tax=Cryptosporidium ryanae TaxID=515981 RepID=UPI00351A2740|nr:hypothetical protein FG386_001297 [Cryptosporidium ryanae]